MLLAIDTATRVASIALYNSQGVIAEVTWHSRENHTVELMTQIVRMMELAHVEKGDLEVVGIGLGPGSFTGLRVGMSVAKGFALGAQIPLLGVPTMDALVHAHAWLSFPIWAVLAAGRGRYSVAQYTARRGIAKRVGDYALVDAARLVDMAYQKVEKHKLARLFFCGDVDAPLMQLLAERLGGCVLFASPAQGARRAAFLAELAWARYARGESGDAASLAPMYMPHESVEGVKK